MEYRCGVYEIICIPTQEKYVGSSVDLSNRFGGHRFALRHKKHHSKKLQASYDIYGETNFRFRILCYCGSRDLDTFENLAIKAINPEFNTNPEAHKNSPESIEKTRRAKIGRPRLDMIGNKYCLGKHCTNPLTKEQKMLGTQASAQRRSEDKSIRDALYRFRLMREG